MNDKYKYTSVAIAFYIIAWANKHKFGINLTKVQKLLYIAYGAALVFDKGRERLCNEHPQAWPFGPVFPTTRNRLLRIKDDFESVTFDNENIKDLKKDSYLNSLIKFVFEGFGSLTAAQLTAWSHQENSPWELTTQEPNFHWGNEIPDHFIYEYFSKIINVGNG